MKFGHLTLLLVAAASLAAAPSVLVAQPPGAYGEEASEEFSERAGVDEGRDFDPGADELEYESDVVFPGEPFDYAPRVYGGFEGYDTGYYDYDPYFDDDIDYDNFYTDDWFSDESAFDSWYDRE